MQSKYLRMVFYSPEDEGGTGGDGGETEFSQMESSDDFEIVVSDEELPDAGEPDISKGELLAKIQEQQAAIEAAQARGDEVAALQAGLRDLGTTLRDQGSAEQAPVAGVPFDEEAYKEKFNQEFYNDPYKFMQDFAQKKIGPEFQRMAQRQEELFKREIKFDPERKETFEKYKDEIEKEYKSIPNYERFNDSEAFTKAHDRVVSRHLNEIIEARVQEALEANAQVKQSQVQSRQERGFNESGSSYGASAQGQGQAQGPKKVRLSTAEARWAETKGLTTRKAYEVLQRRPELRRAING